MFVRGLGCNVESNLYAINDVDKQLSCNPIDIYYDLNDIRELCPIDSLTHHAIGDPRGLQQHCESVARAGDCRRHAVCASGICMVRIQHRARHRSEDSGGGRLAPGDFRAHEEGLLLDEAWRNSEFTPGDDRCPHSL